MNAFYEHHRDSIRWHYRCFDRILLNGLIQPFQQPERVVGFFNTYRRLYPVSRQLLHGIADHCQKWLKGWTEKAKVPVVDAPKGRCDEFVDPYFKRAKPDAIVVVLKAREPARIMIAIGDKTADRWHLQFSQRWVVQYNVYINDARWGRMFVRMCPYLPFCARICVNQHHCSPEVDKLIDEQSREADPGRRKTVLWQIERKLAQDGARPIIFYPRGGTCRQPYVKGWTATANTLFNGWRLEDVWLDK